MTNEELDHYDLDKWLTEEAYDEFVCDFQGSESWFTQMGFKGFGILVRWRPQNKSEREKLIMIALQQIKKRNEYGGWAKVGKTRYTVFHKPKPMRETLSTSRSTELQSPMHVTSMGLVCGSRSDKEYWNWIRRTTGRGF